jgi:mycothiol synthase
MTFELRPPRVEDAAAIADVFNRHALELDGQAEVGEEDVRVWLTAPQVNPETDARIAIDGDRLCGAADVMPNPEPTFWIDLRVPPSETEPDAVREALAEWAEARAREWAAAREGALLRFFTPSTDEQAKRLLEARGYRLIRHSYRMRIDFEGELPEPEWPDGITIRRATLDDARAVYDAHQESFLDSWEPHQDPFDEWRHWMTNYPSFDPTLWFIAEENLEVAGVSLCMPHNAEEGVGWIRVLGVRRPWRRRGLGRALLLESFHEFRGRGFHAVGLGVDAESLTGAHRLYENAGMRVVRQSDIYEKPV